MSRRAKGPDVEPWPYPYYQPAAPHLDGHCQRWPVLKDSMSPTNDASTLSASHFGSLLSAVFLATVVAEEAYGTILALSGTVSLGYFPVILGVEGIVAGFIAIVTGLLASPILKRTISVQPLVRFVLATAPFAVVWVGFFFLTNYQASAAFLILFVVLGVTLYFIGLLVSLRVRARAIPALVAVGGVVIAVLYPWLLAILI